MKWIALAAWAVVSADAFSGPVGQRAAATVAIAGRGSSPHTAWTSPAPTRAATLLHAKRTDEPPAAPGGVLEGLSGESRLQLLFAPIFGVCFYQAASKGQFAAFGDPLVAGKAIVQFVVVTQVLQFAAQQAKARRE